MTIQDTLEQLRIQVNDLVKSQIYADLKPKFKIRQDVWVKKFYEYTSPDPNGFYIQSETQTLESSVEMLRITSIEIFEHCGKGLTYRYHVSRYSKAPSIFYEDELFSTKAEAMEVWQEKFDQSLEAFVQRQAEAELRKQNEARKILGLEPI